MDYRTKQGCFMYVIPIFLDKPLSIAVISKTGLATVEAQRAAPPAGVVSDK